MLKMNHPSVILECTTRAASCGEKEKKFASQIKQLYFFNTDYDTQFDTVGHEEITKYKFCFDHQIVIKCGIGKCKEI